jgi:hypothetical protein
MEPETLSRPWLARLVRLTAFLTTPWEVGDDAWERLTGEQPDRDLNNPKQRTRLQVGAWQGVSLQLQVAPGRIDLVASVQQDPAGEDVPFPPAVEIVPRFLEIAQNWLPEAGFQAKRLALGLNGLLSQDERATAYSLLNELVPSIRIDPNKSTDLLFQINWPADSQILEGTTLNRLTKWSWLRFHVVEFELSAFDARPAMAPTTSSGYVSVECDNSTPAEREDSFDPQELVAIYDELAGLAWRNLEFGERAP